MTTEGSTADAWVQLLEPGALPWWRLDREGRVVAIGGAEGMVGATVGEHWRARVPAVWHPLVAGVMALRDGTPCTLPACELPAHRLRVLDEPDGPRVVLVAQSYAAQLVELVRSTHRHALSTALVRALAHDAGNELMNAVAHVELARTLGGDTAECDRLLELAVASTLRLGGFVHLLGAAAGRSTRERRPCDLRAWLESFTPTARLVAGRHVALTAELGVMAWVSTDDDALATTLAEVLLGVRAARCARATLTLVPGTDSHRIVVEDCEPSERTRAAVEAPPFARCDDASSLLLAGERLAGAGGTLRDDLRADGSRRVELVFPAVSPSPAVR